jgi:hypothetical protein
LLLLLKPLRKEVVSASILVMPAFNWWMISMLMAPHFICRRQRPLIHCLLQSFGHLGEFGCQPQLRFIINLYPPCGSNSIKRPPYTIKHHICNCNPSAAVLVSS